MRVEDTDTARSKKEYDDNIIESLTWLGLPWDEFYRQSERISLYKNALKKIVNEGKAYISKEEVKKEGARDEVIRFKNPNKKINFADIIRGEIEFDTKELGDFVIAKSMDEPLYHFAAVTDDFLMGITHVIRGDDHISNTPRQILIGEALGAPRPIYAHIPLILAPDSSKLSKRHGSLAVTDYRDMGYTAEAVLNYLALLGWNPGTNQEIFSLDELAEIFDLKKVHRGGAIFDIEKLKWFNREYIKKHPELVFKKIQEIIKNDEITAKLSPLVNGRIHTTEDIKELFNGGELDFINLHEYDAEKLIWKDSNMVNAKQHLEKIKEFLEISAVPETSYTAENIKNKIWEYAEKEGRGNVLWPMRYALTGMDKSPDPFTVAYILGRDETIRRFDIAILKLSNNKK